MRQVRILREAADEATEAAAYYEEEKPGLGSQFEAALHDSLLLLAEDIVPLGAVSPSLSALGIRRLVVRRFPYSIIVCERGDVYEVLAFAHHARRPRYWESRLNI